ncbi:MAG: hypothetical protein AAFV27_05885 [Pseudomonadota bacterium]
MKQAASILGIIGGILGLIMGISLAGWIAFTGLVETEAPGLLVGPRNPDLLKGVGVIAPILAIAGGAMAVLRPAIGAVCLGLAAGLMAYAFGLGFFALFPVAMCAMAALFAVLGSATKEPGAMPKT